MIYDIGYKNKSVLRNCLSVPWHPILIDILSWIYEQFHVNREIIITEGWRALAKWKPSDIHCTFPLRAFDLRSRVFNNPESIEFAINHTWQYDPERPEKNVALLHNVGQGLHFHLHSHPNTVLKIVP